MTDPRRLSERLRDLRLEISRKVTDEFYAKHPDWLERFGAKGRIRAHEDAAFHIDFLAGALEVDSIAAFENYARWAAAVLGARKMAPKYLVEHLEQIGNALSDHLEPGEDETVRQFVVAASRACLEKSRPSPAAVGNGDADRFAVERDVYVQAILNGQREAALTVVLEAIKNGAAIPDLYVHVLQEAQYEVGRRWESNAISVAAEHMASAITQYVVARIYPMLEREDAVRGQMVITGVEGELHQIGANMVADLLESDGWDVRFLGTNMPHSGIIDAVVEHDATVLGISATMLFNLSSVSNLIHSVRAALRDRAPRIILGGAAPKAAPDFFREVKAEGMAADLIEARELMRSFA